MARNVEGCFSYPNVKNVDSLIFNGVQHFAVHYAGCQKCPSTWEREPYYERSIKERKMYPLCNNTHQNSSRESNFSCIGSQSLADQLKLLEDQLKVSKNNDGQMQNLGDFVITRPDIHELEKIVNKLEIYTSSFKSKLKTYKENEKNTYKAETIREKHLLSSALDASLPGDVNSSSSIHSISISESSDDEITEVSKENEELGQENERNASKAVTIREKHMLSSAVASSRPRDHNADTSIHSISTSEPSDDEVREVSEENEELVQETPDLRKEQSLNSSSEDSSDSSSLNSDNKVLHRPIKSCETNKGSLAESEIHSDSNRSSSLKKGKSRNKNVSDDKGDKFETRKSKKRPLSDPEEQQSSEKRNCSTSKQKGSLLNTSSEVCKELRIRESQRPVELESTELSLYETAKETSFQPSETLEGYSSGSATP